MVAKLRLLSALCAVVAAVIVVWQTNPAGPARVDAADIPMTNVTTSIKWPVIETVDPDPFDPCRDIPMDVVSGSAWPSHRRRRRKACGASSTPAAIR